MKKLLTFVLVGAAVACQQPQKETAAEAANTNAITCEAIGPVKLSYSHADLEKEFGADKLTDEVKKGDDGTTYHITRVFKDTPEEIIVRWSEQTAPFGKASSITVANEGSPYETEEGIRVGSTLSDLKSANNFQPIVFTNFFSHLDGFARITSFSEGELGTKYPCLSGMLDIEKQKQIDVKLLDEFKREKEVKSSHKALEFMDVKVVELSISAQ